MRPDISFWTWVLARRIPVFALVTTLVMIAGASLISHKEQTFMSTAELFLDPRLAQEQGLDTQTYYALLKLHALKSSEIKQAISELSLTDNAVSRIGLRHDVAENRITLRFRGRDPEDALFMAHIIVESFVSAAQLITQSSTRQRIEHLEIKAKTLRENLAMSKAVANSIKTDVEMQLTAELYQTVIANLATAKADLLNPNLYTLNVTRRPVLLHSAFGATKSTMYLALIAIAIFCGSVALMILEWLDTVVRRPHDVEATLGIPSFGVIPDLHLYPAEKTAISNRGI